MQVTLHQLDLLLLFDDDALSKTPQNWIAAVDQFELGHVDRALVMRNHHRCKVAIRIARRLCGHHAGVHALHGLHHLRCKPGFRRLGTRIAVMALGKRQADKRGGQHKC